MGEERAAWARLPREEREKELRWYHDNFNTPDDLVIRPPELDGGYRTPKNRAGLLRQAQLNPASAISASTDLRR